MLLQDTPKKPPRRRNTAKLNRDHDDEGNKIKDAVNNNSDDSNASSPRQQHTVTSYGVTDDVNNSPNQSVDNVNCETQVDDQLQRQYQQPITEQLDNTVLEYTEDVGEDYTEEIRKEAEDKTDRKKEVAEEYSQMDIKEGKVPLENCELSQNREVLLRNLPVLPACSESQFTVGLTNLATTWLKFFFTKSRVKPPNLCSRRKKIHNAAGLQRVELEETKAMFELNHQSLFCRVRNQRSP